MKLSYFELLGSDLQLQFSTCNCISCLGKKINIPKEVTNEVLDLYHLLNDGYAPTTGTRKLLLDDVYLVSWDSINE